MFIKILLDEER